MNRRRIAHILACGAMSVVAATATAADRPNILLCVADDWGGPTPAPWAIPS